MSVSVKLELDMRYKKKDSTYPLKLLIVINRKPIRISLGYAIEAKDWNESKQTVRTSCKRLQNITRLNAQLTSKKAEALTLLTTLKDQGKLPRVNRAEIKSLLLGKSNIDTYLIQFFNIRITEMRVKGSIGNARVYRNVRNSIKDFLDQKDIPLNHVSYEWLQKYDTWFLGKGNRVNGLSINLRTLRALLNEAIKRDLLDEKLYPFKHYSIQNEVTSKRAIAESDIEKIKEYKPTTLRQTWAKDYFLMSYYMMGASFVDLAFLKLKDWEDGRIRYKRKKGGKLYNIKVTAPLRALFEKYSKGKQADDFILNAIYTKVDKSYYHEIELSEGFVRYENHESGKGEQFVLGDEFKSLLTQQGTGNARIEFLLNLVVIHETEKQYRNVHNARKYFNSSLKEIAKSCKISADLTSYVARHSFATVSKFKGIPIGMISQALGHDTTKTTEIYLAEFETKTMDDYLEKMVG